MTNKQRKTNLTVSDNKSISKKKWLALTAVSVALLLIPRRSSRKDSQVNSHASNNDETKNEEINQ